MSKIVVTRSENNPRDDLISALVEAGYQVDPVSDPNILPRLVARTVVDLAFIDVNWLTLESLDIIHFLRSSNPRMEIVVLTSIESIRPAASAILRGASLYLVEPVDSGQVVQIAKNAMARQSNALMVREAEHKTLEGFFGTSPAMTKLFRIVLKVAPTDATVLITGESGTGKELLAQILHRLSPRFQQKFVAVNCAAIPEALLESELFGHVKGSFTGAVVDKKGILEDADNGTCFLDEVGELAPSVQAKLLRFLQDRSVRRVGGTSTRHVNVRILAATNRNLVKDVAEGRFREDLFYRINVISLHLLPLRERKETLPFLVGHLLSRLTTRYGKEVRGLTPEASRALSAYAYPGNIRELENILEYAVIMADGPLIEWSSLPPHVIEPGHMHLPALEAGTASATEPDRPAPPGAAGAFKSLEAREKDYILEVLNACGGNQTKAARILGISRTSLWRRLTRS